MGFRIPGVNSGLRMVNESGMYALIMGSRKPEAKKFRKWVTSEVLPTIRKTGGVFMTKEVLYKATTDPDFMIGHDLLQGKFILTYNLLKLWQVGSV